MKRVAILKSKMEAGGGLEKYAFRIAQAFVDRGAEVTVLTAHPPRSFSSSLSFHAQPKSFCCPSFVRIEQFDRFTQNWLSQTKPDLVFGMDRNRMQTHFRAGNGVHAAYLDSRVLTEGKFKRWVCSINPLHQKILQIEKEAFENPRLQKLFANSHMVRGQILDRFAIDPAKVEVIHNGVEWKEMEKDFNQWESGRAASLSKWDLDPNCFHFLFIGNGYLRKGLDPLLEAMARLPNREIHLSVVGKDKRISFYQEKCKKLGLSNRVRFFGPQKEIRPFYQLADALAIPSFYDPFANVTVEALAMGLWVISSKSNGGHEILSPGNGAIIENLLDVESVKDALLSAFSRPKTPLSALAARRSVEPLDFSKQLNTLMDACWPSER